MLLPLEDPNLLLLLSGFADVLSSNRSDLWLGLFQVEPDRFCHTRFESMEGFPAFCFIVISGHLQSFITYFSTISFNAR